MKVVMEVHDNVVIVYSGIRLNATETAESGTTSGGWTKRQTAAATPAMTDTASLTKWKTDCIRVPLVSEEEFGQKEWV